MNTTFLLFQNTGRYKELVMERFGGIYSVGECDCSTQSLYFGIGLLDARDVAKRALRVLTGENGDRAKITLFLLLVTSRKWQ